MGNHGAAGCVTTVLRSVLAAIFTEPPLLYAGDATESGVVAAGNAAENRPERAVTSPSLAPHAARAGLDAS
jgi:hypothetical protein